MEKIEFVRLGSADLDSLYEIEQLSFSHPWTREAYRDELENNSLALYWGCRVDGQLAAFAGLWRIADEGHITNIATHPQFRRRGLGEWLLRRLAVEMLSCGVKALTLEVRSRNSAALALYRKLGFEAAGLRKNYYDFPDDDAVIMWWRL